MTHQPLKGKRVVVTRSPEQAEAMGDKLEALGAVPILFPAIQFAPLPAPELDNALTNLPGYDWLIFTSANAVRFFFNRLKSHQSPTNPITQLPNYPITNQLINQLPITTHTAAVGSATTRLLAEKGVEVDFVPDEFTGELLALGLGDLTGKKVLLPRAKIGRPEIVDLLREQGAVVTDIGLYDTITAEPTPESLAELQKGVDAITFTSPSSVRNFLKIVRQFGKLSYNEPGTGNADETEWGRYSQIFSGAVVACIGPSTAAEAEEYGLTVDIIPDDYTIDDLISAVADYYTTHSRHSERVKPKSSKHE